MIQHERAVKFDFHTGRADRRPFRGRYEPFRTNVKVRPTYFSAALATGNTSHAKSRAQTVFEVDRVLDRCFSVDGG